MIRDSLLVNRYIEIARKREVPPDSAIKIARTALVLAKKRGFKKETGVIWYVIGNKLLQKGDRAGCQPYIDSISMLNAQLKDGELTCVQNTLAARKSYSSNDFAKAALYYFRAIQPVRENKVDNPRTIAVLYQNLGVLMTALKEDSMANSYLSIAREYVLKIKPVDSPMLLNVILCQAGTYVKLDSNDAIGYYKDAYAIARNLHDSLLSYTILLNLTESYIFHRQYDSAEYYFHLAQSVTQPGISIIRTELVSGYLAFLKKDYATSILHLKQALKLTNGEENQTLEVIYEGFSDTYAALGDYRKAYEFHQKWMDQHTLLYDGQKKVVADFMLNFQALEHEKNMIQKQAEISFRDTALKKQQSWIAAMCVVSGLLCIILILAYRNYRHKKSFLNQQMHSLLQDQEIARLKAEAEGADKERSRIAYDLHDGVLVRLANVKMNLTGSPEAAVNAHYQDVIGQLDIATRELRNTAHNLMPEILLEDGLAQAIFYFCKATEQASGLHIKFQQIGPPLPQLVIQAETAVYRIVQGLVQNIVQHAGATASLVQLQYADNLCSITVEDNGRGMPHTENNKGYGIRSIRNRVKILQGTFDIESEQGQGTTVYLEFDVRPFLNHSGAA
ncbi:tetratricopeptide repeat-containing sensor histidine kinase [Taibaiella helva]|uniref:tetratricopeptide repeat-containing sensor histidine kinase n=1 Tax=Taibaiella helva TaxID=2301235 RepID=UPI0018E54B2D|nr:ATP-binding protein [Taibaiella helva]